MHGGGGGPVVLIRFAFALSSGEGQTKLQAIRKKTRNNSFPLLFGYFFFSHRSLSAKSPKKTESFERALISCGNEKDQ